MTSPRDESPIATSNFGLKQSKRVLVIFGTRPEAIKLSPLIAKLKEQTGPAALQPVVCVTAQHREMLDQVLAAFQIEPDYDLDLMRPNQTLPELGARLLSGLAGVFSEVKPAMAVVQGDTATTLYGALAAFYARVPLAHVEAGLRTFDMQAPFPEEMNRVLTNRVGRGKSVARRCSRRFNRSDRQYRNRCRIIGEHFARKGTSAGNAACHRGR
jgi:UDP-N-acetylglucosamine 2-epimerase